MPEHRAKGQHRRNDLHLLANSVHQRGLVDEWVSERLYRGGRYLFPAIDNQEHWLMAI